MFSVTETMTTALQILRLSNVFLMIWGVRTWQNWNLYVLDNLGNFEVIKFQKQVIWLSAIMCEWVLEWLEEKNKITSKRRVSEYPLIFSQLIDSPMQIAFTLYANEVSHFYYKSAKKLMWFILCRNFIWALELKVYCYYIVLTVCFSYYIFYYTNCNRQWMENWILGLCHLHTYVPRVWGINASGLDVTVWKKIPPQCL